MALSASNQSCPYCQYHLDGILLETANCPHCMKPIYVFGEKLLSEETATDEWLAYLRPLAISKSDFNEYRQQLSMEAGGRASINDTIWRILNSSVGKYVHDKRKLYFIYLQMAELVASEWKDPHIYLEQAERYSPNGFAFLERNSDPIDKMINLCNDAFEKEKTDATIAIRIYEFLLTKLYPHPGPYERLRVLYAKQGNFKEAIRVCKAFLSVSKKVGYESDAKRFKDWIEKYNAKIK